MMEERMKTMLEEGTSLSDVPMPKRYEVWLTARQKKSGDYTSEATTLVASKIEELVEKNIQGTYVPEGREDILTKAIGTKEHPGRIRTEGRFVGFKEYYGKSSRSTSKGISMDDLHIISVSLVNHWQLLVVCPDDNIIYWFCSLGNQPSKSFKDTLLRAMRGYNILRGRIANKKPNFITIKAHQQKNSWACGYYVMKNMFDIIQTGIFQGLHEIYDDPSSYDKDVIDNIRQLWAQFFLQIVEEQHQLEEKEIRS
ncbi:uncharacterized protein LOC131629270 [Vicia villosa]|uniref:uncharacterized protein LOC131629270 n=1 Tax=Vicia villosa TaxID=3911 RepID=UPI00273B0F34|nr:uncharacterized protein LOC131629270 [Vicia villosa]